MKKLFLVVGIVLGLMIGFVVITQILFRGDYYRLVERQFFSKDCPAIVYITGEYTGTAPEVAVIESEIRSLGFKTSIKQSEDEKINIIVAGKSDDQTEAVIEKARSVLLKLGNFQEEIITVAGGGKAKTCPLD